MKKTLLFFLAMLSICNGFSQDITGEWNGAINVMGQTLPLVFHIEQTENGYSSTMDSPKQKAFGIKMTSTIFRNDSLFIQSNLGFSYAGSFTGKHAFDGEFNQNGRTFPLLLSREKIQLAAPKRPQNPEKPYPYISEQIYFKNEKAGITLAGTLTLPEKEGKFPAVVLISGSGPQNRNGEILGHKPFLVLSDYLTRNGIAVLRYDDRGINKSGGKFLNSTSADFATDTKAAVNYLLTRKEIDQHKIGLIGHSEGGMIAPMVAVKSDNIAFLVLLAAPGIPMDELMLSQAYLIGKASGMTKTQLDRARKINKTIYQMLINSTDIDSLKTALTTYLKTNAPEMSEKQLQAQLISLTRNLPWRQYLLQYDPRTALRKVDVPVLALTGENDLQVAPKANLEAIEKALKKGGNQQITTKVLPGLNHLFQESKTGSPSEYGKIEQTFSPKAMRIILDWIKNQVN